MKTRLASTIGVHAAAALARGFFVDTLAAARTCIWARTVVVVSGDVTGVPPIPDDVTIWPQGDGDLGERLERGLRRSLEEAPSAIAIGTDTPGLPTSMLAAAAAALAECDAVVGPTDDGGFYLLGLRRCPEGLLSGLPWSTETTCERTLARLHERGLSVAMLGAWFDVDHGDDLERLRGLLRAGSLQAPATADILGLSLTHTRRT